MIGEARLLTHQTRVTPTPTFSNTLKTKSSTDFPWYFCFTDQRTIPTFSTIVVCSPRLKKSETKSQANASELPASFSEAKRKTLSTFLGSTVFTLTDHSPTPILAKKNTPSQKFNTEATMNTLLPLPLPLPTPTVRARFSRKHPKRKASNNLLLNQKTRNNRWVMITETRNHRT